MLCIRPDGSVSEIDEIDDVRGNDRPPFSRRIRELGRVVQLGVADLMGACCVYATLPKESGEVRREILIEVDLHRVKRTSPGYCFSIVSGVSASFAAIFA